MPLVIAEPVSGVKDRVLRRSLPVNCIYEGEDRFYIHPDECIDCRRRAKPRARARRSSDNSVPKLGRLHGKNRAFFAK